MWLIRKIRFLVFLVALVAIGTSSGGLRDVAGLAFMAYLLWRAFPAVSADVRAVWSAAGSFTPFRRGGSSRANSTL